MREQLSQADHVETDDLRQAIVRLSTTVRSISELAEEALSVSNLEEPTVVRIEFNAGRAIRLVVQDHLRNYLTNGVRGFGLFLGAETGKLDVDSGELYPTRTLTYQRDRREVTHLSEREWFNSRSGIVGNLSSLKFY